MEEIDLKEIFNIFWTKKWIIVICLIIFMGIGAGYSYFYVTPKYKAYTTLVLTGSNDSKTITSSEKITQTDISLNNSLVATYSELVKSKTVLRQVISNLEIEASEDSLKGNVSVSVVKSSQMIQIDVVDTDPYKAKIVANEVGKVFTDKVKELYNMSNIHVVDEAEEPISPYNISHVKDIAMFGAIGVVLACAYIFIMSLIDTTVKNEEDIERKLGISVLVELPKCNFEGKDNKMKNIGGVK